MQQIRYCSKCSEIFQQGGWGDYGYIILNRSTAALRKLLDMFTLGWDMIQIYDKNQRIEKLQQHKQEGKRLFVLNFLLIWEGCPIVCNDQQKIHCQTTKVTLPDKKIHCQTRELPSYYKESKRLSMRETANWSAFQCNASHHNLCSTKTNGYFDKREKSKRGHWMRIW